MLNKTITSALLNLRAQIIREGRDGLDHVEALLQARVPVLPRVARPHAKNSMPRLAMARLLVEALNDGPKGGVALAAYVADHQPSICYKEAQARIHQALARMMAKGLVVRDGRMWRLAYAVGQSAAII